MNTLVADALIGRTVDNRYAVESRIAVGGMATVYRAIDLRLDRPVALKVMRDHLSQDADFRDRFHREARTAARLTHPNAVGVYDQGEWEGLVFLVMEYVNGRNLRAVLRDAGPLSPQQALTIVDQVLQALEAAHRAGFIHRDIKPENVLVTPDDLVKVTDFGLARTLQAPSAATTGMLLGTAAYLSPEQVAGEVTDERGDIYQVGILLYELLTGSVPFSGETSWSVANQHLTSSVPPLSERLDNCPAELDALVMQATRRAPTERISTVAEFREAVDRLLATLPAPQALPNEGPTTQDDLIRIDDASTTRAQRAEADGASGEDGGAADPGDEAIDEPDARRSPWLLGTVMTLLAIGLVAATTWLIMINPLDRTDVPMVVGSAEDAATSTLTAAGFEVSILERNFSETVAVGDIISTDPPGGEGARTGSEVGMIVSLGPERYAVPKLRGDSPEEATTALQQTNLSAGGERLRYHDKVADGLVIATKPKKGKEVKRDTEVTLIISKGPAPVDVPDLRGTSEAEAKSQLDDLGLDVSVSTQESETVAQGLVIQTAPSAGATLYRGDSVEVVVSEGPPPVPVPDVVDMSRREATRTLEAAGFAVEASEGVVTPLDRVFESDPPAGTLAPVGSTVVISIF